jgi:hypothetical protein
MSTATSMLPEGYWEFGWYSKFLISGCESIDDMIAIYEDAVERLKSFRAEPTIVLDVQNMEMGCPTFWTQDAKVAEKFGFQKWEEEED